jgi:hypothetical protein
MLAIIGTKLPQLTRLALAATTIGLFGLAAPAANASPLAVSKSPAVESLTVMVRDGCGRGMRFSHSRDTCVEQFDDRRRFREERVFRNECRRGQRFSNRRQRCVWIDEDRRGEVDGGAVAAGVALGVLGAVLGSGNNGNHGHRGGGNKQMNQNNNQNGGGRHHH